MEEGGEEEGAGESNQYRQVVIKTIWEPRGFIVDYRVNRGNR